MQIKTFHAFQKEIGASVGGMLVSAPIICGGVESSQSSNEHTENQKPPPGMYHI